MKLLKDTFLFEMQDKSSNLKQRMLNYNPSLDNLELSSLEEPLQTIQKRYSYPSKNKVIADLSKKHVIPIYNKERVKVPTFVPAYLYSLNGQPVCLVNLTNYANKTKEGHLHVDTRQLFACLQTGSILLGCFQKWNSISMNQTISKLGCSAYSKIFSKVIDKMFAINLDPIKSDKMKFLTAKFFLINLLGKANSETVNSMAYACCTNGTSKGTITSFDAGLPKETFDRLDKLIETIETYVEGCHTITIRTFLDTYIKMYGTSAIFALEYFPYFCHMIFSVAVGAHLNSEYLIEGIVGKEMDKLYNELNNIIR